MSVSKSSEMFINMQDAPKWDPKKGYFDQKIDVLQFYQEERKKITKGVNIGGFKMSPWLYFHLNYFKTPIPTLVDGVSRDKLITPPLNDNTLYIDASEQEARSKNKALFLFGCRGFTKTSFIASYSHHTLLTVPDGIFSIIGGSGKDLNSITELLEKSLTNIDPAFYLPFLNKDWDDLVRFGWKEKQNSGKTYVHSSISITKAEADKEVGTEKGAGLSPIGFVIDEALHEDSKIYYPGFEKPIKDVKVGDYIYGSDGNLTKVIDKIDPGVVDMYQFTLSDGRQVKSSSNHLWKVYNTVKNIWQELTTEQIFSKYFYVKYDSRYNKYSESAIYSLPVNSPIEYPKKGLKIDPYWLGLYLGDGFTGKTSVCSNDVEILDYCKNYAKDLGMVYSTSTSKRFKDVPFDVITILPKIGSGNSNKNPLRTYISEYGIGTTKDIPKDYLYSSVEDRIDLLRGIMDTDGGISKEGNVEFSTSIPSFADSFEFLCRSLGLPLVRNIKESSYKDKNGIKVICKDTHRFKIKANFNLFNLSRKKNLLDFYLNKKSKKSYHSNRSRVTIRNISKVGKSQAYCIKVDNSDKLFLTENFISTHNCGKFSFKKILESAIPSFKTPHGYRLVPILSGTSGNEVLSRDAKDVLENPEAFDILPMNFKTLENFVREEDITWGTDYKRKFGTFVPGQMSLRLKTPRIQTTLGEFLKSNNSDLRKIKLELTDWKNTKEEIIELSNVSAKEDSRNRNKMYYPLRIDDCFLTTNPNPFPVPIINKRIRELEDSGNVGKNIDILKDGAEYTQTFSDKRRAEVSHKGGSADAPIVLFGDLPKLPPEKFEHTAGLDDYKLNQSDTDSLGAMYILRRRNTTVNSPCETIVASYVARPDRHNEFHGTCETMLECWNAECLMEAIDVAFEEYLEVRMKAHKYLAPGITFAKSKVGKNRAALQRKYGLPPTAGNNEYRMEILVNWCWEKHTVGFDEKGNAITKYSVEYIDDIDLLKELRDWEKGKNSDRKEAFSHALLHARMLDKDQVRPKSQGSNFNVLRTVSSYQPPMNEQRESNGRMQNKKQLPAYQRPKMSPYTFRKLR